MQMDIAENWLHIRSLIDCLTLRQQLGWNYACGLDIITFFPETIHFLSDPTYSNAYLTYWIFYGLALIKQTFNRPAIDTWFNSNILKARIKFKGEGVGQQITTDAIKHSCPSGKVSCSLLCALAVYLNYSRSLTIEMPPTPPLFEHCFNCIELRQGY